MRRRQATDPLEQRIRRVERRVEDAEDALTAALAPDRIDDLSHRVEELAVAAVTHDDLLRVRTDIARLAAELTRVRAELQAEVDQVSAAVLDLADARLPRRAAG